MILHILFQKKWNVYVFFGGWIVEYCCFLQYFVDFWRHLMPKKLFPNKLGVKLWNRVWVLKLLKVSKKKIMYVAVQKSWMSKWQKKKPFPIIYSVFLVVELVELKMYGFSKRMYVVFYIPFLVVELVELEMYDFSKRMYVMLSKGWMSKRSICQLYIACF